jgi:hypothetical protein
MGVFSIAIASPREIFVTVPVAGATDLIQNEDVSLLPRQAAEILVAIGATG